MRKQFKKGVAILSAVSMVAAGISYVPQNVKADAPVIAVQDSEEGVDYSSLTYTQVGEKDYYVAANNDDFPIQEASDSVTSIHIVPGVAAGTRPIWPAFTDATLNGESIENTDSKIDGAGIFVAYSDLKDNAYNVFEATSAVKNYKFQIIIKAGNPDGSTGDKEPVSSDEASPDTTTTTEPTTTTTEPTTTTTEAPEVTTPAKVLGLMYAGNETLPFYFAWQSVAGANGYNVYLDGKLITKVDGVTYEFSKDLFAEAREYIIAVAAVNEAGEGTKTEYKYTVESKEPDSTKNEETDSTKNEESNSSSSTEENVKVPVAVTGLAYTGTEEASFKFSWDASEGAESYNVYLNDKFVTSTVTPEYSFDSALFEKAGTYTISVEAVNKAGKSDKTSIEYVVKEPASSESTDESKDPQPSSSDESKDPQQSSTDESKDDNTEVTMPSDYTAFENNADFGYKFVSAPEAAKAEVKTDQGENLFIAFNAVEGFLPDYTGLKVNGTDRDVPKGTGITLPKSLLTKKVNEVVILDKDGKEIVINIFNIKGKEENPVTKPEESNTSGTDESKTTSTKNEETDSTKNEESNSSSSTEEDVKVPVAVTGLAYTGTEEASFKFSWDASKGAESYNVYLNDKFVTSTVTPEYSFDGALFEKAGTYTISVEAVNKAGKSDKTSIEYVVKEPASSESTDESKGDNTEVTMPSDYTAFENNADFGYKFVSAPEAAKAEVKTDQGENLFIAFNAVEGFLPDYTGLKVNGTDRDVSKGTGITLPKSLLTKKVNEVIILDKDGKEIVINIFNVKGEGENPATKPEESNTSGTEESKTTAAPTTEVTMPSDYTAFENNADFGYKFVSAPEAAKAEVKTDQGENLFIAFKAVEGFYPDYTGLKVNGTDVDVAKGAGITLPKSLLTKKVNEVVILDKDGKEVVLNVFNVNGEGEIPTSPSVTEPDASTPDVSTPDVSTPDASTPDVSTPDVSTPDVSTPDASTPDVTQPDVTTPDVTTPDAITTSTDVTSPDATSADVTSADVTTPDVTTPDASTPDVSTTPKVTTAKPTVKPTTAKPTTKKASLKKTKITKKITKKLSSKKVKLTFKKVKGAKKYTVQVSTSKKFKKVLYKKTVKKTKVTLSSKKLKNKKKLYVRVKAVGAKKWSKAVKIKVK
ncbi:hypothetical protein [Eubacterium sp.]|uniref:hypothetical protein n=1 Tax=Eubacterium sp. TaxID=142586 RepID=UPI003522943A